MFYNTPALTGTELREATSKADKLEALVLSVFKEFKGKEFRAYDIEQLLINRFHDINHDSVKRAITDLATDKWLCRSERARVPGPYGVKVNVWWLSEKQEAA